MHDMLWALPSLVCYCWHVNMEPMSHSKCMHVAFLHMTENIRKTVLSVTGREL